ncbi:hypothetical protein FHG87_012466 [Trinorchestia longiramus]|nr:hypothetical protein FHG87_012466 [Trinorchestia longiramus]
MSSTDRSKLELLHMIESRRMSYSKKWNKPSSTKNRRIKLTAPLLPQSQPSSKSRTSSPATAISQSTPNANPKPLTTLLTPPLPSTPAIPSRPAKAPTYRVQLKTIDQAKPADKQKFFEITFRELNAPLIRLTTTRTGYYAVTDDVTSIDKLTSKKATTAFEKINLTPIIPPDLRAKRTVFIRQIDADIGLKPTEEIKNEIKRQNDWLTVTEGPHNTCCQLPIQEKHNTTKRRNRTTTETRIDSKYLYRNSKTRHSTNKPTTAHTNINKPNTHQTHSRYTRSTHSSIRQNKKFGDILTESLKLNFNIDTTFLDRDSTAIFSFYYDKTDSQQPQMTQTAPQEEHTIDQTIDTAMDETDAATYTEIRQKRRMSDGMEDSKLLMDNKYTTYVKLYRN